MTRTTNLLLAFLLAVGVPLAAQCPVAERPGARRPPVTKPGAPPLPPYFQGLRPSLAEQFVVPWQPWFPAVPSEPGERSGAIKPPSKTDALDRVPYLVVLLDGSRPDHWKDLDKLIEAPRVKAATLLFERLRLDTRATGERRATIALRVHAPDGELIAEAVGPTPGRALAMLDAVARSGATRLSGSLADAERILEEIATDDFAIRHFERQLVCPRCGEEHARIARELIAARNRLVAHDVKLSALRRQLWSRRGA